MHEAFWNGLFDVAGRRPRSDRRPFAGPEAARARLCRADVPGSAPGPEGESRWHASKDIIRWLEDL